MNLYDDEIYDLKVANESRFLLNINMLPNLPFTHAKHDF